MESIALPEKPDFSFLSLWNCLSLQIFFFDTVFVVSDEGLYFKGFFYNVIYISGLFYLVLSVSRILANRKKFSRSCFIGAVSFNITLFFGYVARIMFPNYLIMNLASLLAIIIIFFTYENPVFFLAGKANAYNKKALYAMFAELCESKSPLLIGFVIYNYNELREIYSGRQMDRGIALICEYIEKKYPDLLRFYLHDGRFVLLGRDNSKSSSLVKELTERFCSSWSAENDVDISLEVKFVQLAANLSLKKSDEILNGVFSAFRDAERLNTSDIVINEETIRKIEHSTLVKRAVEYAVEHDEVEMFLQPLVNTSDYKLVGAEALARIRDDKGNLVSPGLFIPIAEKNGRISMMGEQMFEKACKFIHDYDIDKMGISWINVNLSPIQFLRHDLNQRFSAMLEKYNVSADKIHLEITEATMIDYVLLKKQIDLMQKTGFQFVLDDYGSGYSNVSRLKRCPFINIKLDMEIVQDYFKDCDKILPALVHAFKQMNFTVTAEGVETLEMAESMKKIGCDFLQGFYFSKPLPVSEFVKKYGN